MENNQIGAFNLPCCQGCPNNPNVNPQASGICCCSLPSQYNKIT